MREIIVDVCQLACIVVMFVVNWKLDSINKRLSAELEKAIKELSFRKEIIECLTKELCKKDERPGSSNL
jgi:uncharacterized membrane protein YheB (UPF0754 family)